MVVVHDLRIFHTVCRNRQFFIVCRTTCFFGISLTTLSPSTYYGILFRVSLITELKFGIDLCFLIHLFILLFPEELSYEMNVASIRGTCPYLALHNFTLFGEEIQIISLLSVRHPLSYFRFAEYAKIPAQLIFLTHYQSEF